MQKGFTPIFILLGIMLIVISGAGVYYFVRFKNNGITDNYKQPKEKNIVTSPVVSVGSSPDMGVKIRELVARGASQKEISDEMYKYDDPRKDVVNSINASIKKFFVDWEYYPKDLGELKKIRNFDEGELERYSSTPFYYDNNRIEGKFFVKLNDGQFYYGEQALINKNLDAIVWVDVDNLSSLCSILLAENKPLPDTLEGVVKSFPDTATLKVSKNPVTGKPYTYIPDNVRKTCTLTGTVTDGSEYSSYPK